MKQENRIQINGEWYVKESSIIDPEKLKFDVTHTEGYIFETSNFCFEATKIFKDDSDQFYDGLGIEITNKITNKSEYWDNDQYLKSLLEKENGFISEVRKELGDDTDSFLWFLNYLRGKQWL